MALTLVGYPVSPFVRKVRVVLETKGIAYDLDPVVPYTQREKVLPLNPAGTVPVLVPEGGTPIPESADIVTWAEARVPLPAVIPADPKLRERALAVQNYADTQLAGVFGGMMFGQRVIVPYYFGKPQGKEDLVTRAMTQMAPPLLDQIAGLLEGQDYVAGGFGIGDIALSSWLRAAEIVGFGLDAARWPEIASWLERCHAQPGYAKVIAEEETLAPVKWARARYRKDLT
ncbi:glutathione S-transferase family protein [Mameliella alba]|nr:glutathione S-transferase family protein [Mameliella alba]MBY6170503.1 glutathione S-transferase family protein [Mameliella alba]MBY6175521.1 glutathione S-transferase family protein [Mameliella alba]